MQIFRTKMNTLTKIFALNNLLYYILTNIYKSKYVTYGINIYIFRKVDKLRGKSKEHAFPHA